MFHRKCIVATRAARAIPLRLVYVARTPTHGVESYASELGKKISRFVTYDSVRLKPKKNLAEEEEKMMKLFHPKSYVLLFDPRGRSMTSEEFAHLLADAGDTHESIVACVGGAYGVGEDVKRRADATVQMSKMIFSHEVARLVALEQLYRAWTILRGEGYHHG